MSPSDHTLVRVTSDDKKWSMEENIVQIDRSGDCVRYLKEILMCLS